MNNSHVICDFFIVLLVEWEASNWAIWKSCQSQCSVSENQRTRKWHTRKAVYYVQSEWTFRQLTLYVHMKLSHLCHYLKCVSRSKTRKWHTRKAVYYVQSEWTFRQLTLYVHIKLSHLCHYLKCVSRSKTVLPLHTKLERFQPVYSLLPHFTPCEISYVQIFE